MTERERIEREIILDILAESSKWRISEDDQSDCIRLEVMDRARRLLLGTETVDANGYAQSEPDNLPAEEEPLTGSDFQALEAAKLNGYLLNNGHLPDPEKAAKAVSDWKAKRVNAKERWKHGRVRVTIDGRPVWKLESDCHKEIIPGFEKKWHWVWNGPQDKKAQEEEAMWAEHEQGNKEN